MSQCSSVPVLAPPPVDTLTTSLGRRVTVETLVEGLNVPADLVWGPDGVLWLTEREGRISRIDAASGKLMQVGRIDTDELQWSGLMGIALHPSFESNPYVYVAQSYKAAQGGTRNRVFRMTMDRGKLADPRVLITDIPGSGTHNGGRLTIGADNMLYITTGDAGQPETAQQSDALTGKVLRTTLEGYAAPGNPFRNLVWTLGHRNSQGLVFVTGTDVLFATEHGPFEADELNRIVRGKNYGWPHANGECDLTSETAWCDEHEIVEPVLEFTPTLGIAGVTFHDSMRSSSAGTLLIATLAGGSLMRLSLNEDATRVVDVEVLIQGQFGRLRAVAVDDLGVMYVATSNRDHRGKPQPGDDRILRVRDHPSPIHCTLDTPETRYRLRMTDLPGRPATPPTQSPYRPGPSSTAFMNSSCVASAYAR